MVEAVRGGRSQHEVARAFHVSPSTVHRWVRHAHGRRPDRVDGSERSRAPHTTPRTVAAIEDLVLDVRCQLQSDSDLGFYGASPV
jgi:transposase-like protein